MAGNRYIFDLRNFSVRRAGADIRRLLWTALKFVLTVLSLLVLGYAVFALVYSTDEEKALKAENELYSSLYSRLPDKLSGIGGDLERLSRKDELIYKDIFHSDPPAQDPMSSLELFFGSDSIPDSKLVFYTARKAERLMEEASAVDSLFGRIVNALKDSAFVMPPMELPLRGLDYTQTGAGIGMKINPFYTTAAHHNGVDFIVGWNTPVFAPAPGTVTSTHRSLKGEGNSVTIRHKGGYLTRYTHLAEINVSQGQSIRKGALIGKAGMSGNAYAPHLHYEVRRDTLVLDPLNYIFASVTPEEYSNMVYMALHTQQSMD